MNHINNLLPEGPSRDLDFSTVKSFKDSAYSYVYSNTVGKVRAGDHSNLSTDDATILQIYDDPNFKPSPGERTSPSNPLKDNFFLLKTSKSSGGTWYRYDGIAWVEEASDLAIDIVHVTLRAVHDAYEVLVKKDEVGLQGVEDEKKRAAFMKRVSDHTSLFNNDRNQSSPVAYVEKYLTKAYDPFEESDHYILADGRALCLSKSAEVGEAVFEEVGPEYFIHSRNVLDFTYSPGQKPGKALTHYLNTSFEDPETGINLCLALGAGLFSLRPKKFFSIIELYGQSNTGKSALIENVLGAVAPGLFAPVDSEHFGRKPNAFALREIRGKRLLSMAEYTGAISSSQIKKATGEDLLRSDVKNQDAITFKYHGVIIITANSMTGTALDLSDVGNEQRVFPVIFPHKITDGVMIDESGVSKVWDGPDLKSVALPSENDQTMSWLLDITLNWEKNNVNNRIPLTASQERQILIRKGEADVFQQFMDDMVNLNGWTHDMETSKRSWITASDLQARFHTWLVDRGMSRVVDVNKEMKKLKDDNRIFRESGVNRLVGWVENPHFIRNHASDIAGEIGL